MRKRELDNKKLWLTNKGFTSHGKPGVAFEQKFSDQFYVGKDPSKPPGMFYLMLREGTRETYLDGDFKMY